MKICASCGWDNDDDFNFCLGCGSPLPSKEEAARAATKPPPEPEPEPVAAAPAPTPEPTPAPVVEEASHSPHTAAIVDVQQHLDQFAKTQNIEVEPPLSGEPTVPLRTPNPAPQEDEEELLEEDDIELLASTDMLDEVPSEAPSSPSADHSSIPPMNEAHAPLTLSSVISGGAQTLRDGEMDDVTSSAPQEKLEPLFDASPYLDNTPEPAPEPTAVSSPPPEPEPVFEPEPEPVAEPEPTAVEAAPAAETKTCPNCGTVNPADNGFCGSCGTPLRNLPVDGAPVLMETAGPEPVEPTAVEPVPEPEPEPEPEPAPPPSPASLVLLLPNGQEGGRYPLKSEKTILGRKQGNILFLDDPYISPSHATFEEVSGGLTLEDNDSLNGLFLRLRKRVEIEHGDIVLMGKQLLRFETLRRSKHETTVSEETQSSPLTPPVWGSPWGPYWGRLVQIIEGGYEGNGVLLGGQQMELGRERGHITFPNDRFISGIHARILALNGKFYLEDVGSRNGTFIRIRNTHQIQHEDVLIIGEQLMRVELNA